MQYLLHLLLSFINIISMNIRILCLGAALLLASVSNAQNFKDGLVRSSPEEQGVRSEDVSELFQTLTDRGYELHSLMILRHGKVIAEHWWAPYAPQYPHAMYSNTKSWTAMAIGFAVQEGLVKVSDRVVDIFPDLVPEDAAPETYRLTVEHLLTMSAGHAPVTVNPVATMMTRYKGAGDDLVRDFLSAKYAYEPGTSFEYNVTCSHMLSNIISRVTGQTILEYLRPRLFEPLGVEPETWEMDLSGRNMGNGGLHLKTSDMAKFGQFLLNKGVWNGVRLLDGGWIEAATTPHIYQRPNLSEEENAKDDSGQGYGYQIWMGRCHTYRAIGAHNQVTMVLPDYDMVVVSTGSVGDEAGFNSMVYDFAKKINLKDKKIKKNKGFNLEERLAAYELKKPFKPQPESALKGCARKYRLFTNNLGLEAVALRFDKEGNVYVTLESASSISNLSFGISDWMIGHSDRKMAFSRAVYPNTMDITPYRVAGLAAWESGNVLRACSLSMFNVATSEHFRFIFDGDKLKMEIPGPGQTLVLEGVLVR